MQHMRKSSLSRIVAYFVAVSLLIPQLLVSLPLASAQTLKQVTTVAVIPFVDISKSGKGYVAQEITSAAALALEDTREFSVTSTSDLDREMAGMRMTPPLSQVEQIRLGQRLQVEKVLTGTIASLSVNSRTGECAAEVRLLMLDVGVGEVLDGAVAQVTTKAIPGWSGDTNQAINEAMRAAAESAVAKMLGSRVRRGNIDNVDDLGFVTLNLGADDGLVVGTDLLVMRPQWQPDLEKVIMRRVGVVRVKDLEANLGVGQSVEGSTPSSGDKVYRIYKPANIVQQEAKTQKVKSSVQLVAALLLLAGLVGVAGGETNSSASELAAALTQARPGETPFVRLHISTSGTALNVTHGYLFFRAANNPDFAAVASYLFDVLPGKSLTWHSDEATTLRTADDETIDFKYKDEEGNPNTDGSVSYSFVDNPLVRGTRYYYKVRRITDPLYPPGTNPPIGTTQVTTVPIITPSPDWSVISEASDPAGPVTYFIPPALSTPTNGAVNQPMDNMTFRFQPSVGANEYRVEVFPSTDQDGLLAPLYQSAAVRDTGSSLIPITIRGPFTSGQTYWWRVGARQTGDAAMPVNQHGNQVGWLYSELRSFTAGGSPPTPPSTSSAPAPPNSHRGFWGGDARNR